MRDNIENEAGQERLGRAIVILVVAGAVGVVAELLQVLDGLERSNARLSG